MQCFLFGTNLKMHQTPVETQRFVEELRRYLGGCKDDESSLARSPLHESEGLRVQLFVVPPFTSLTAVADACAQAGIWLGAQNMHWEDHGAFTGEISPVMIKACGANLVMLGHAERRQQFGETDAHLNKKVLAAARYGLRILLCVGETAEEKRCGTGQEIVARQLKIALSGLDLADPRGLLILYEPVWSIGTGGEPAAPDYVAEAMAHIRCVLGELFGESGAHVPILYGGSVDANNCDAYARLPECDGLGVGRAAWRAQDFARVLNNALKARQS